jgi:hypothetical protein
MQGSISLLLASSVFSCKILTAITEIARENTEKIAVNILHENTEEDKRNEIDPCINVNAKQIVSILKQG